MTEVAAPPEPASAERTAVWEDFIDIFYAPSAVFGRRAQSSPWVPLAVVTALMTVLVYVNAGLLEPTLSAEFGRSMAIAMRNNPGITPEAADNLRRAALRFGQFGGIFTPVGIVITGTMVWLLGKLLDAK